MSQIQQKVPWSGWEVTRHLGGGSFGNVYEIQRNIFGTIEKAAMKVVTIPKERSELNDLLNSGYDQESINKRFLDDLKDIANEYMIMAELKGNANIIYSEDIYHEESPDGIGYQLFIKMELLEPLNNVISNPASEEQVIKLGMDICNALAACRRHNIIHRDIKPQNILVSKDGNFKLGDFGVSKTVERTAGGTKTGTYKYMAPEVYNNKPYGAAVDIYSLGMVLYVLLNRRCAPFLPPGMSKVPTSREIDEANQRRFNGEPLPPPVDGNPALHKVVLKACAFRAEDRYSSPEEMYAALMALKESTSASGITETNDTDEKTVGSAIDSNSWTNASAEENTMGNDWGHTDEKTMGTAFVGNDLTSGGTVGNEKATARQQASMFANLTARIEITPEEARNGCKKNVYLEGRQFEVTVPAGTSEGQILRLQGAGKTDADTGAKGDALITVYIKKASEDFWKKEDTYDKEAVISSAEAASGKELDMFDRKITIPPGTKDGDVIDSVKVYVHDFNINNKYIYISRLTELEKFPDIVLEKYAYKGGKNTILSDLWSTVSGPLFVVIVTVIFCFLMAFLNSLHTQFTDLLMVALVIIALIIGWKSILLTALLIISLPVTVPLYIIETKRKIQLSKRAKDILQRRKK